MEPASALIDEAADLAADGKVDESVEKYRKALIELDRIEMENPDRAKSPEFATLRNKRAYVNAAIDSMLLSQVKANAKAVAVSDTTELEKRLAEEKSGKKPTETPAAEKKDEKPVAPVAQVPVPEKAADEPAPATRRERAMACVAKGDYETAAKIIDEMLAEKPDGVAALNLKAMMEAKRGNYKDAEAALDRAIATNPRSHFAYYNMARLILQIGAAGKPVAQRYYETGRSVGGPVDEKLEAVLR